jgi:hypothetical protein
MEWNSYQKNNPAHGANCDRIIAFLLDDPSSACLSMADISYTNFLARPNPPRYAFILSTILNIYPVTSHETLAQPIANTGYRSPSPFETVQTFTQVQTEFHIISEGSGKSGRREQTLCTLDDAEMGNCPGTSLGTSRLQMRLTPLKEHPARVIGKPVA